MFSLGIRIIHMQKEAGFVLSKIGCMRCSLALEARELALCCLLHTRNQQMNMPSFSKRLE